jgi:lysozyme
MSTKRAKQAIAIALAAGMSVAGATATILTKPWESKENVAYWDAIGKVWTVCFGETEGVKPGDRYTDAECETMLLTRMEADYLQPLRRCLAGFDAFPFTVKIAFVDLGYNVGTGAVCKSTAGRRAVAKDWAGACEAMTWFNKAGGKVIRGLDLRRKEGDATRIGEREICLAGL